MTTLSPPSGRQITARGLLERQRLFGMQLLVACTLNVLTACATHDTPAPRTPIATLDVNGVLLINAQPTREGAKLWYSDGVTTLRTEYRAWTQQILRRLASAAPAVKTSFEPGTHWVRLQIESIACSGQLRVDCTLTVLVTRADDASRRFTTPVVSAFPAQTALEKVIDASADQLINDRGLMNYLRLTR